MAEIDNQDTAQDVGATLNDPLFSKLDDLKSELPVKTKPLVPTLKTLFGDFREQLLQDFTRKVDAAVQAIKEECLAVCQAKDDKVTQLETTIARLEDKLDAAEAYERKDSIIISGAVGQPNTGEITKNVAVDLIKAKLGTPIEPTDISICHRLQTKPFTSQSLVKPPNIYVKLVRRDHKQELIRASKRQNKEAPNKVFVNESLTRQRSAILQTLLRIKKDHDVIKGVTSMDGDVYAYTAAEDHAVRNRDGQRRRDVRHRLNTRAQLQKFCNDVVKKPLEQFIINWPKP